jgi:hypothetical protein
MRLEPFRIAVSDAVLQDLNERLARTRFPDEIADSGWTYGTELAFLRGLVAHWYEGYDWRVAEAALNRFPQFRAEVNGLGIHLIHARGVGPRPFPIRCRATASPTTPVLPAWTPSASRRSGRS